MSVPRATEFGSTAVVIEALPLPSNETEPDTSPTREIVLGVWRADAVVALPATFPVTSPRTWANVTEDDVLTAWPIAIVGLADSPELLESVTPVPATSELT